jgi:hypothetical protein
VQEDEIFADDDDILRTPTESRPSIPLSAMKNNGSTTTSRQDDMIADMSLPDFSDGDITEDGPHLPSEDWGEDGRRTGDASSDGESASKPFGETRALIAFFRRR